MYGFAYHQGTKGMCITFVREDGVSPIVYCESDYAGDVNDCKSTSGILVIIGSSPVGWYSSKQTITAQSTTDTEMVGMNQAVKEIIWLRNLFREMHLDLFLPTKLKCDNTSSMKLAFNPVFHKWTKHIMVKFQYLVDQLKPTRSLWSMSSQLLILLISSPSRFQSKCFATSGI